MHINYVAKCFIVSLYYCLKYLGLVVGQPFLEDAQELNNAAVKATVTRITKIFFIEINCWLSDNELNFMFKDKVLN